MRDQYSGHGNEKQQQQPQSQQDTGQRQNKPPRQAPPQQGPPQQGSPQQQPPQQESTQQPPAQTGHQPQGRTHVSGGQPRQQGQDLQTHQRQHPSTGPQQGHQPRRQSRQGQQVPPQQPPNVPQSGAGSPQQVGAQPVSTATQQPKQTGPGIRSGGSRPRLAIAPAEEIIQTDVVTVDPGASIEEAVSKMRDRDVGCVVVVDEDDRPQGVVTDRTVALALAEMSDIADEEVMTLVADDVATGATEMNIFQIVETMSDATVRRLPIVDEDGTLAGIVTIDDITVLLSSELNSVSQILESQSPRL